MEALRAKERTVVFHDKPVHMHVVRMAESFYAWVGDDSGRLDTLAVAIQTRFNEMPSAREVLNSGGDDAAGRGMAMRLAKRFKVPVFLSVNIEQLDAELALFVERELVGLIAEQAANGPVLNANQNSNSTS